MRSEKDLLEFEENPYNTKTRGPEEIVRLFYSNDVPVLPVVSKRGILLGILTKERVISELSDIERAGKQKIDDFIMHISKKMSLDELLPIVGNIKEFVVINLFGEVYGKWTRLDLFAACEQTKVKAAEKEAEKQKEEQVLEWMIYLVLEHIPRPLYAVNNKGKTIFYNSLFEDIFIDHVGKDIDTDFIEKSLANPNANEFFYKNKDKKDIYFFNKDIRFFYERIPLISSNKNVGYLIFIDRDLNEPSESAFPGIDMNAMSLNEIMQSVERSIIVDSLRQNKNDISKAAKKLKVPKNALLKKINNHGIDLNNSHIRS